MPIATVAAIIKNDEGEILLTRRSVEPYKDQWCLPGGHIDQYENVKDATIREIREETGLDFNASFFDYSDEIIEERHIHAVVMVFTGPAVGQIFTQENEVTEVGWFSLEEAQQLPLAFEHNKILLEYSSKSFDPKRQAEVLAEYSTLRSEILKRMDLRQQLLTFTLLTTGAVFSFVQNTEILLLYPVLVLYLARTWVQNDARIWDIAQYIRKHIEPMCKGINWETYMLQKHQIQSIRPLRVTSGGVFFISGIVAVILAKPNFNSLQEIVLLIFSVIVIVLTFITLGSRSKAMNKSK